MANMELITSVTVGSGGAASVTLPATGTIPATYTDLRLVVSARTNRADTFDGLLVKPNNSSSNLSYRYIRGDGSTTYSNTLSRFDINGNNTTASTFGNLDLYIPNYASSDYKSMSGDSVTENNALEALSGLHAWLWSDTSAITTLVCAPQFGNLFLEGSTFYLYGISNVTSGTKATGGVVSSDGTYYYHMFPFSGTFTPTQSITADVLCIAGGGAGGGGSGCGGGGAGGLRLLTSQSLTTTGYTITVGAGGATTTQNTGNKGSSSSIAGSGFTTISSTGGGGGGSNYVAGAAGATGGSGGGGGGQNADGQTRFGGAGNEGSYTPVEGFAGGNRTSSFNTYTGGGGGGSSAAGQNNPSATVAGNGGAGTELTAWSNPTGTGANNGFYAGGGGAGNASGTATATGGVGGGGNGGQANNGSVGTANTGGGGGGAGSYTTEGTGGAGGSGLVIIRYTA